MKGTVERHDTMGQDYWGHLGGWMMHRHLIVPTLFVGENNIVPIELHCHPYEN